MIARLIVGASASILLLALFASAIWWSAAGARDAPPAWTVTRKSIVNRVLIVEVVARRDDETKAAIVASIIDADAVRTFDEILIYVRAQPTATAGHRVQWTRGGGYHELVIR